MASKGCLLFLDSLLPPLPLVPALPSFFSSLSPPLIRRTQARGRRGEWRSGLSGAYRSCICCSFSVPAGVCRVSFSLCWRLALFFSGLVFPRVFHISKESHVRFQEGGASGEWAVCAERVAWAAWAGFMATAARFATAAARFVATSARGGQGKLP